jgi:hypothetical protein
MTLQEALDIARDLLIYQVRAPLFAHLDLSHYQAGVRLSTRTYEEFKEALRIVHRKYPEMPRFSDERILALVFSEIQSVKKKYPPKPQTDQYKELGNWVTRQFPTKGGK